MAEAKSVRVNWGIREDTQQKVKEIMELMKYGSDGDVADYAIDRLHSALFSEPNVVVTVAEAVRARAQASDTNLSEVPTATGSNPDNKSFFNAIEPGKAVVLTE